MKLASILLLALTLVVGAAAFHPAQAQGTTAGPQYSLLDVNHRLSVDARLYRSFDEEVSPAGSYTSGWWAGVPLAYVLTGHLNANGSVNPLPLSIIGAVDFGLQGDNSKRIRGYVGIATLLKSPEWQ